MRSRLVSVCCIRVNDATNHGSGTGPSFEVGEMSLSRLHHCCNKLCAREGEKKGTTTQGNVASGQQHRLDDEDIQGTRNGK